MAVTGDIYDEDIDIDQGSYPPWNFSWVVEGELAAMACPTSPAHLEYIMRKGVRHLVTLSPEKVPSSVVGSALEWTMIPIKEFEAPSVKEINKFIDVCHRCHMMNQAVGVHCRMGRGRTGVMAACFLVRFKGMTPERAIGEVRSKRPGSVETYEQERAVVRYHDCFRGTRWGNEASG